MSDYIKREKAIEYLVDNMTWMDADGIETSEEDKRDAIAELINGVPSADVAPVRHGHWIHERLPSTSGGSYAVIRCSECQLQVPTYETRFCPNCGAKMDEENNND